MADSENCEVSSHESHDQIILLKCFMNYPEHTGYHQSKHSA